MRFPNYFGFEEFVMLCVGFAILTASGCGIAWQFKTEKVKACPVEQSSTVRLEIEQLQKSLDEFRRRLP